MSKSTTQLNSEEQLKLRNKAEDELKRLELIFADEETTKMIDDFKRNFAICEIVYKVILDKYKSDKDDSYKGNKNHLIIDMRQVKPALKYAGYDFDENLLNKLFGSEDHVNRKSVKKIRDELTHSIKESAVEELRQRETELYGYMEYFLQKIRTFDVANVA